MTPIMHQYSKAFVHFLRVNGQSSVPAVDSVIYDKHLASTRHPQAGREIKPALYQGTKFNASVLFTVPVDVTTVTVPDNDASPSTLTISIPVDTGATLNCCTPLK